MGTLWMMLMLLAIACAYSLLLGKRLEQALPLSCFSLVLVLYLFGLLGILRAGVYACALLACASLVLLIIAAVKNPRRAGQLLLTPGLACYFLLFALVWFGHRGRLLTHWDEFSHWGLVVKNMTALDALGNHPDSTVLFQGYQPGVALFQYLWQRLGGGFNEDDLYRAMNVMVLIMLFPVLSAANWKSKGKAILLAFATLLLPLLSALELGTAYTSIYVDVLLGAVMAYILFTHFTADRVDGALICSLSLAIFFLTLVKSSGAGLAGLCLVIILVDAVIRLCKNRSKRTVLSSICLVGAVAASLLAAKVSWDVYLRITGTPEAWASTGNITLSSIRSLLSGQMEAYRYDVIRNFVDAVFGRSIIGGPIPLPFAACLALAALCILGTCVACGDGTLRRRYIGFAASGIACGILYALSVLLLYVFSFGAGEALALASFSRYMGTYALAFAGSGALLLFYHLARLSVDAACSRSALRVFMATCALCILISPRPLLDITALAPLSIQDTQASRENYSLEEVAAGYLSKDDRVYYIAQGSTGNEYYAARFIMAPASIEPVGRNAWSIGSPRFEGDIWTLAITVEDWLAELGASCTHVYLYNVDELFIDEFGAAFADHRQIHNNALFEVVRVDGAVHLEYIAL